MSCATLQAQELAERLGVSTWAVYQSVREGTCPVPAIRVGRRIVFSKAAVEALLGAPEPTRPTAG
jgi:excisionase family DNA binding protein